MLFELERYLNMNWDQIPLNVYKHGECLYVWYMDSYIFLAFQFGIQ